MCEEEGESPGLPDFADLGLPHSHLVDWKGATEYIQDYGKMVQTSTIETNTWYVKSRSRVTLMHHVRLHREKVLQCSCERYENCGICSHSLAIAFRSDRIERFISAWTPNLSTITKPMVPLTAGKKKNDAPRKRRNAELKGRKASPASKLPIPDDERFHVRFLEDTKSTTCYGCGRKFRASGSAEAKPPPNDMVLGRKSYRVFSKPGNQTQLCIAKTKENVYFHAKKKCVAKKHSLVASEMIVVDVETRSRLSIKHKKVLLDEFNARF